MCHAVRPDARAPPWTRRPAPAAWPRTRTRDGCGAPGAATKGQGTRGRREGRGAYLPRPPSWCRRRPARAAKFLRSRRLRPEGRVETWKGLESWYLASTRRWRQRRAAGGGAGAGAASSSGPAPESDLSFADTRRAGLSAARHGEVTCGVCARVAGLSAAGDSPQGAEVCAAPGSPCPAARIRAATLPPSSEPLALHSDAGPGSAFCLFKAGKHLPRLPPARPLPRPLPAVTSRPCPPEPARGPGDKSWSAALCAQRLPFAGQAGRPGLDRGYSGVDQPGAVRGKGRSGG